MMRTVVVVGASVAGGQAVQTLRAEGYDGRVVLVGEEADRPYERPPLSKELLVGAQTVDQVFLRPERWYADNDVDMVLGTRARSLVPGAVVLESGREITFDACLLATGGRVRTLPFDGIRYLRTLPDSIALKESLASRPAVVVIGAGFIGAEVASSARKLGCPVTLLEIAELPLQRVLARDLGELYRDLHAENGVAVRLGEGIASYEEGFVVGTSGRRYEAQVVLAGVGIQPNVELAASAGIDCADGILVNERCETSMPGVYAAGDVARHPNPFLGVTLRVEHLQNAQRQGAAAARCMLGKLERYADVPWFWSDQYDVNLQMLGHPSAEDDTVTRGDVRARDCIRFSLRGDLVAGAVAINRGPDVSVARRLVERRVPVERTLLADDDVPLRNLLRS